MPSVDHVEKHFTATAAVRDIVIGMSDGLTGPVRSRCGAYWRGCGSFPWQHHYRYRWLR